MYIGSLLNSACVSQYKHRKDHQKAKIKMNRYCKSDTGNQGDQTKTVSWKQWILKCKREHCQGSNANCT